MKFNVWIESDDAALNDPDGVLVNVELKRILDELGDRILYGVAEDDQGFLLDANGIRVGSWYKSVEPEEVS